MQYNPAVTDRSADYVLAAAQTNADMMNNIGSNIGGALMSIGGKIADRREKDDMGDMAYEALGAIGEMYPGMKSAFTALGKMDPRTRRLASMSILDNLGAISQLGIAGMNNQTRQQGQQIQQNAPFTNAGIKNATTRAEEGDILDGTALPSFN